MPQGKPAAPSTSSNTEEPKRFTPSTVAILEHRARQQADEIMDQIVERFNEKNFLPDDGDGLLFAMLTCLPKWPGDTQIKILDGEGNEVACYLKGDDESIVNHSVMLVQRDDGTYAGVDNEPVPAEEPLLRLIFDQLPDSSELGYDDDESLITNLIVDPVVLIRDQVAKLARSERALLFDALLAGAYVVKSDQPFNRPNPYLPIRSVASLDLSPVLVALLMQNPQVPVARLTDLLLGTPLTETQKADFLEGGELPEDFMAALATSIAEWTRDQAIDGLFHARSFNPDTDVLARDLARKLLMNRLGRELIIIGPDDEQYQAAGPDVNPVVLQCFANGDYRALQVSTGKVGRYLKGTDSFYLAISSLLQPTERATLGIHSEDDVVGFRRAIATLAVEDSRGWFAPQDPDGVSSEFMPRWFKQASRADKLSWRTAVQVYWQALTEAQTPGFPDVATYGEPRQLREYARKKLEERLKVDIGLDLNPDDIWIETTGTKSTYVPPLFPVPPLRGREEVIETRTRSLTDLSLQNVSFTDLELRFTGRAFDANRNPINALSADYLYGLVRDLDVGNDYSSFLKNYLLSSSQGKWHQEHYVQVLQAQMRLDALEARIAGDYLQQGGATPGQDDLAYTWVAAVLDQPVNDDRRAQVEGGQIQAEQVFINGYKLDGLLIIGPSDWRTSEFVVFTPLAPDGKCFRVFNSLIALRELLLGSTDWRSYVINMAAPDDQAGVRYALVERVSPASGIRELAKISIKPCTGNFLESAYVAQVERVLAAVDEQTNSTSEGDWESVWQIAGIVTEIVLTFLPFKVALPIASFRSIYAALQSIQHVLKGDLSGAGTRFIEAIGFLAYGLRGSRGLKPGSTGIPSTPSIFDPKKALSKNPKGLTSRTDGRYNGIHELSREGHASSYYVVHGAKTYPVRYDRDFSTWRLVDPRRPDAYYQMPVIFKEGKWVHARLGLLGGTERYTLDLTGFEGAKVFRKADEHIQKKLRESIRKVTEKYAERGGGKFHGYKDPVTKEKIFTLDLTGMPSSKGRGPWRLQLKEREKGVLVFDRVLSSH
ncbi:dermonecrotic toxin domain-containing protein [Pseudomonas viridiflava]|uniref:dermonecrotic toxin domain-containing protein n=1 Tax=Pseudomonas viridiflava TaxID=33069 RepID=UPI000F05FC81|nr:DUF6543 domain-containing protein [Pseudomonas viridiflava]